MSGSLHLGPTPGEGELRGITLGPERYLLLVRHRGRLYCLDDWCNHAGCLLSEGRIENDAVVCHCHEVAFALDTGVVVTEPRICDDQRTFEVLEEDGEVFLKGEGP